MRITTAQIRQAIRDLDAAEEAYRRHREGFDRYSQEEQARRTAEATAAYRRAIEEATDLVESAHVEASAEIERIESGPDLADITEIITTATERNDAANRMLFISSDVERLSPDLLALRLERVAAGTDQISRLLHYRAIGRRLESMAASGTLTYDATGRLTVPANASPSRLLLNLADVEVGH